MNCSILVALSVYSRSIHSSPLTTFCVSKRRAQHERERSSHNIKLSCWVARAEKLDFVNLELPSISSSWTYLLFFFFLLFCFLIYYTQCFLFLFFYFTLSLVFSLIRSLLSASWYVHSLQPIVVYILECLRKWGGSKLLLHGHNLQKFLEDFPFSSA